MSFTIFADVDINSIRLTARTKKKLNSVGFIKDSSTPSGDNEEGRKRIGYGSGKSEPFRMKIKERNVDKFRSTFSIRFGHFKSFGNKTLRWQK